MPIFFCNYCRFVKATYLYAIIDNSLIRAMTCSKVIEDELCCLKKTKSIVLGQTFYFQSSGQLFRYNGPFQTEQY